MNYTLYLLCLISYVIMWFDPTNTLLNLKYHIIILLFTFYFILISTSKKIINTKHFRFLLFASILPTVFTSIRSFFNDDTNFSILFSQISPFLLFFLIFPLLNVSKGKLIKILKISSVILIFSIFLSYASLFSLIPDNKNYFSWLYNSDHTLMGHPFYFGISVLFYKSSSVLILPLGFYIFHKSKSWIFILILTLLLVLSGTRANIIGVLIIFLFNFYRKIFNYSFKTALKHIFSVFALIFLVCLPLVVYYFHEIKDLSYKVKTGHLIGYLENWNNKPVNFIFGDGFATPFYSFGFQKHTYISELSYLEFVRRHGIVIFIFFMYSLFIPIKILINNNEEGVCISYITYLLIAGTNPLLISSTGISVICFVYAYSHLHNTIYLKGTSINNE